MITNLRLENFKGHRDTNLALKQLTLLVGDNGSGKSSVLEAIRFVARLNSDVFDPVFREVVRWNTDSLKLTFSGPLWKGDLRLVHESPKGALPFGRRPGGWKVQSASAIGKDEFLVQAAYEVSVLNVSTLGLAELQAQIGQVGFYRFRADQVAASSYSDEADVIVAEDGAQTSVVLAALKLADDEAFGRIEDAMRSVVPSLQRLRIKSAQVLHPSNPNPVVGSKLYLDFLAAKDVPAHHASQGTLVLLALLTVLHSANRPRTILLDDFDQILHPRAQMELVRMIKLLLARDEFQDTQIIATTHSPYVLDEVDPSNVIAFALREDGIVATKPLSEHPDAAKVSGSLKTGELWTLDAERDWVL